MSATYKRNVVELSSAGSLPRLPTDDPDGDPVSSEIPDVPGSAGARPAARVLKPALLADECVPGAAVRALRDAGHEVLWIVEMERGRPDVDVMRVAAELGVVLLTADKDFGLLTFHTGQPVPPGIVLIRAPTPLRSSNVVELALGIVESHEVRGFYTVVTPRGVRQRALPGR